MSEWPEGWEMFLIALALFAVYLVAYPEMPSTPIDPEPEMWRAYLGLLALSLSYGFALIGIIDGMKAARV